MTKVKFLGQNLVLPSSFWYRLKALEKFILRKCPYVLKKISEKGFQGPPKSVSRIFKKFQKSICPKNPSKNSIFSIFVKSLPQQKNINFLQIPFLFFGSKKPLKVKNWIFQVFWGFKCIGIILAKKNFF